MLHLSILVLLLHSKHISLTVRSRLDLCTPRKCQLFGVWCEAKSEQVNYLIDENDNPGKGANCVVSLVHHYLEMHTSHNQEICLHADNAVGQNKNNTMMQYLCWRIITGKSLKITLSFMMAGHTTFTPDRFFGLLKKSYRRTSVSSMKDIEGMVCLILVENEM